MYIVCSLFLLLYYLLNQNAFEIRKFFFPLLYDGQSREEKQEGGKGRSACRIYKGLASKSIQDTDLCLLRIPIAEKVQEEQGGKR